MLRSVLRSALQCCRFNPEGDRQQVEATSSHVASALFAGFRDWHAAATRGQRSAVQSLQGWTGVAREHVDGARTQARDDGVASQCQGGQLVEE